MSRKRRGKVISFATSWNSPQLELLDKTHLRALKAVLCAYLNDVSPAMAIGQRLGVKKSQAYKYKATLARKMQAGLEQGNLGAMAMFELFDSQADPIVKSYLRYSSARKPDMEQQEENTDSEPQ